MNRIELGKEVKDIVAGFKGIAVARHEYLEGCERITVQPSVDKDGKLPDCQTFDAPSLEVIGDGVSPSLAPAAQRASTGGPEKYTDDRRI